MATSALSRQISTRTGTGAARTNEKVSVSRIPSALGEIAGETSASPVSVRSTVRASDPLAALPPPSGFAVTTIR